MLKAGSHICLKHISSCCLVFRQTYYNDAGILMYMSGYDTKDCPTAGNLLGRAGKILVACPTGQVVISFIFLLTVSYFNSSTRF